MGGGVGAGTKTGGATAGATDGFEQEPHIFPKGSKVEVSTDEEGFKGAWYVATVLEPPPPAIPSNSNSRSSGSKRKSQSHQQQPDRTTQNKYYVEYQSLLVEDGSKPLREYVNADFVRPLPEPEPEPQPEPCPFQLDDVVDGFYRDGWWTGVITRVLDDSRFVVTFQNPPDVIQFGISELRVHREWRRGQWVRPHHQRTTGLMFSPGKNVEVSFDREEFCGVWFTAVVLKDFGNDSFLVEYHGPGVGGKPGLLKVIVDLLHIRPSPPLLKDRNFVLLEKVDAFYDFGWWSGVITKELADSRYVVFFKRAKEERELSQSELRTHMEWRNGKWFSASKDISIPAEYQSPMAHACNSANKNNEMADPLGSSGSTKDNCEATTTNSFHPQESPTEMSSACPVVTSLKKKSKQESSNGNNSQPLKQMNEGIGAGVPSDTMYESNKINVETPNKELVRDFTSPNSGNARGSVSDLPAAGEQPPANDDGLSWGKKAQSKRKKFSERDSHITGSMKKKGRSTGFQVKSPPHSAEFNGGNATGKTEAEIVERGCISKQIVPVVIGLECNGARASRTKQPCPPSQSLKLVGDWKQPLTDPLASNIKDGDEPGVKESTPKRKRGRPRKIPIKSPEVTVEEDTKRRGDVAVEQMVKKNGMMNEVEVPSVSGVVDDVVPDSEQKKLVLSSGPSKQKYKLSCKLNASQKDKLPIDKLVHGSSNRQEKHSSKRTKRRTMSLNLRSSKRGTQDASGAKTAEPFETDTNMEEMERSVDKLPSNMPDDQPLSRWFEGMHSPQTADGSRISPIRTVQQIAEASELQKEAALQTSAAVDAEGPTLPFDNQILPFAKSTPLWVAIESMEVFKFMPQKPHFQPLNSCKESLREGLAIGSMVNFASVVEKTTKLCFEGPRSTITDSLDILYELESHGFDVKVVQDRLTRFLSIKDRQGHLEDQLQELKKQIVQHNVEKTKLDEEIDEIDKQIRELQEKRALTKSMKEIKNSEVAILHSRLEGINEDTKNDRLQFESFVTSPW